MSSLSTTLKNALGITRNNELVATAYPPTWHNDETVNYRENDMHQDIAFVDTIKIYYTRTL